MYFIKEVNQKRGRQEIHETVQHNQEIGEEKSQDYSCAQADRANSPDRHKRIKDFG